MYNADIKPDRLIESVESSTIQTASYDASAGTTVLTELKTVKVTPEQEPEQKTRKRARQNAAVSAPPSQTISSDNDSYVPLKKMIRRKKVNKLTNKVPEPKTSRLGRPLRVPARYRFDSNSSSSFTDAFQNK